MPIPITIVSGFLGAGKTTLVNRLLAQAPQRLAVLVNDFAAINIDATLIDSVDAGRIALTNGCVCCTLREDLLAAALQLAAADPPPERIVIETSGVAEPYGVMEAFLAPDARGRVEVDSSVCLIDAAQFPHLDFASGELAIEQALVCDMVLLNKCDLVTPAEAARTETVLHAAQPAMRILRTTDARIPWTVLLGAGHAPSSHPHHHGGHPAFASWSWQGRARLQPFRDLVARLPHSVLRAKGVLSFDDCPGERAVFQLVGKRSSLTFEPSDATAGLCQVALIGAAADFDAAALAGLFAHMTQTVMEPL